MRSETPTPGLAAIATYVERVMTEPNPPAPPLEVTYAMRGSSPATREDLARELAQRMPRYSLAALVHTLEKIAGATAKPPEPAPAPPAEETASTATRTAIALTMGDEPPPPISDEAWQIVNWLKQWDTAGMGHAAVPALGDDMIRMLSQASGGQLAGWGFEIQEEMLSPRWVELFTMYRAAIETTIKADVRKLALDMAREAVSQAIAQQMTS